MRQRFDRLDAVFTIAFVVGAMLIAAAPALGTGSSPTDPIPFDPQAGPIAVTLAVGQELWFSTTFTPSSTVSHLGLETAGSVDTILAVYANVAEAVQDLPLAEDDDGGPGLNASVVAPLGFASPYLLRASAYGSGSGSFLLTGQLTFVASDRCDWPAGCPLAVAARGEPTAGDVLGTLREVRGEILSRSERGRELIDLYWRLGTNLIPSFALDGDFRRRIFDDVADLLPLARAALAVAEDSGGRVTLSRNHVDRLEALTELLTPHLSDDLGLELRSLWLELGLADQVGQPLDEVLAQIALLPPKRRPHKVIAKLRVEPVVDAKSGRLHTGVARLDARLASLGLRARPVYESTPTRRAAGLTRTISIEVESLTAARALVAELGADPTVEWVHVAAELRAYGPPGPDPFFADLWGLDAVRAPEAWTSSTGQCSAVVAVVDTGLRAEVADFEGRVLTHLGYDFVDDDPEPQDGHGHGTHVSGIVAAALSNSTSVAGVAPDVCVFGVKVLGDGGSGSSEDVAAGIVHAADAGARVINLSLGCDCETLPDIEDALVYAAAHDVVVVAAAGNDSLPYLGYPAASIWTMAVGAVDQNLDLASFSNTGTGLDLVAPGVDVVSVFRDGESCTGSGTSMAAPHVAGVAALARSLDPGLDRESVQDLLRQQARDLGAPGYDTSFGSGLVDAAAVAEQVEPACGPDECLDLLGGRFEVKVTWHNFAGARGSGRVLPYRSDDSGLLYFFQPDNWEMLVKMVDGCGFNGHYWLFAAATTNVEYTLRVRDTQTGAVAEHFNPLGNSADAVTDSRAFATCGALTGAGASSASRSSPPPVGSAVAEKHAFDGVEKTSCQDSSTELCLNRDRFRVEVDWRNFQGNQGSGRVVPYRSDDSGLFYFFNADNWEMLVKVLDGCGFNGHYWVFGAATTNVEYTLRVIDTQTGAVAQYFNSLGNSASAITDTRAFATCP